MQNDLRPVVVVGSINMDLVSRVPRIPRAGETILGRDFQTHAGGKGANQAVGVARLEHPVKMIGMVGKDAFGRQLSAQLKQEGVDVAEVTEIDVATGTATILVDDAGENSIVVSPGANLHLTPEVLRKKKDLFREAGMALAQLEVPIETVLCLAEICSEFSLPLILDPAPAQTFPNPYLRGVTWLTPNETEAQFYTNGASSEEEMIAMLLRLGVEGVILKRGALGSVLVGDDLMPHRIPAPKVQAVDTTAAGDAFNAAFAVSQMNGLDPVEGARFASVAASLSVTRAGAQPSLATKNEVLTALNNSR